MAACWAASSSWAWENNTNPSTMKENSRENVANSDMGLMLGKRTYFEDHTKEEGTVPARSGSCKKKQRSPPTTPTCQVEGCTADLSGSKGYHKRHRVCEVHSKTPKNIVGGIEQRFCQQCSRFHVLEEFDEGKRSCRRRLAGHNERRRKPPPPEPFSISPAILGGSSLYPGWSYGHKQHLLDGTFISSCGSWPDFARAQQIHNIVNHPAAAGLLRLKQEEMAGVYQFFKPEPAINPNPGGNVLQVPVPLESPVGIVGNSTGGSGGALSLLSAEQWGSSPAKLASSDALLSTALQFQPQLSTTHKSGQLNDLVQFHKPLEATLAFDV